MNFMCEQGRKTELCISCITLIRHTFAAKMHNSIRLWITCELRAPFNGGNGAMEVIEEKYIYQFLSFYIQGNRP